MIFLFIISIHFVLACVGGRGACHHHPSCLAFYFPPSLICVWLIQNDENHQKYFNLELLALLDN